MTLKIIKEDLDLFIKVLNAAAAVLDVDGTFLITPKDGITLRSMDRSHSAMVDLRIRPEHFSEETSEFICDKEYMLTLDIQHLKKILQRAKKGDKLTITLDEKNETLNFLYTGLGKRNFVLPLQKKEEEELPPDSQSLEFNVNSKLKGGALTDFIKDASIIGGSVKISAEEGKLRFSCVEERKEVSIEISTDTEGESEALEISTDSLNESLYSIETFKNLLLVDQAFSTVGLSFSTEKPLRLSYSESGINLGYLLAPMRGEDEEDYSSDTTDKDEEYDDEDDWEDEEDDDEEWDDD